MLHRSGSIYPSYFLLIILLPLFISCRQNQSTDTSPQSSTTSTKATITGAIGQQAMVVTAHPLASKVGIEILQKGGNAVDAAVAIQFALAVVYPIAGNIGGGGFMVYRHHTGETTTLDFREQAPEKADRDMYLDSLGHPIPGLSLDGHLAVGVPGTVDGTVEMHRKYGQLPFAQLVQPAIQLADKGFVFVTTVEPNRLNAYQDKFATQNTQATYFQKTGGWQAKDTLYQKDLAHTLRLIRDQGRAGFYEGAIANKIVAEMKRGGGIITLKDLANYKSIWRKPITGKYKSYTIVSMPPPSSGGLALLQLLKMTTPYPIQQWGHNTTPTVHHIVEAERRVYADRATYLGDPDFVEIPVTTLLSDKYLLVRSRTIQTKQATPSQDIQAGQAVLESEETTHFSIVDTAGNAVSITTTLNGAYGSKVFVADAGFLLNNEMDDFSIKPGVPNLYGLVGAAANAISPNKRMLSSMTPTIVEKEGQLFMVVGTPGGSTIITSVFQTLLNVLEHGMSMQEAVNAPRFHHQWKPDHIFVDPHPLEVYKQDTLSLPTLSPSTQKQLSKMGHTIVERSSIGQVNAILVRSDETLEGGADIRGENTALGY